MPRRAKFHEILLRLSFENIYVLLVRIVYPKAIAFSLCDRLSLRLFRERLVVCKIAN